MTNKTLEELRSNPSLLAFYAKSSCKKCYGRGILEMSTRNQNSSNWKTHKQFCTCVLNAVRRARKITK
jgi:peroxiredoxin